MIACMSSTTTKRLLGWFDDRMRTIHFLGMALSWGYFPILGSNLRSYIWYWYVKIPWTHCRMKKDSSISRKWNRTIVDGQWCQLYEHKWKEANGWIQIGVTYNVKSESFPCWLHAPRDIQKRVLKFDRTSGMNTLLGTRLDVPGFTLVCPTLQMIFDTFGHLCPQRFSKQCAKSASLEKSRVTRQKMLQHMWRLCIHKLLHRRNARTRTYFIHLALEPTEQL